MRLNIITILLDFSDIRYLDINVIYVNSKSTNSDIYKSGGFKKRILGIFRK